jgi:general secretion pathway protein B
MSFILDALKKSEAERNRQSGPTLIDMRIAPPRRRLPLWIIALTVILLANLAVLAIVLLRSPAAEPSAAAPAAVQVAPAVAISAATAPAPSNALPPPVLVETLPPRTAAQPPAPAIIQQPGTLPRPGEELADLPSAEELRLEGVALPELRLALHVYDANPAVRYMLLNSQRMREGDTTSDGIRLERITETGAILSWSGRRFQVKPGQ